MLLVAVSTALLALSALVAVSALEVSLLEVSVLAVLLEVSVLLPVLLEVSVSLAILLKVSVLLRAAGSLDARINPTRPMSSSVPPLGRDLQNGHTH